MILKINNLLSNCLKYINFENYKQKGTIAHLFCKFKHIFLRSNKINFFQLIKGLTKSLEDETPTIKIDRIKMTTSTDPLECTSFGVSMQQLSSIHPRILRYHHTDFDRAFEVKYTSENALGFFFFLFLFLFLFF